jgi:hypothetical protein
MALDRPKKLIDRRLEVERRARAIQIRRELPKAFGQFIASLAPWDWFINPFTFRDLNGAQEFDRPAEMGRQEGIVRYTPDPRFSGWQPSSRYRLSSGPPAPSAALARIHEYLLELQAAAGRPIGWVVGEELGALGGRYHCHALITGTGHLRRDVWWERAYQRFGRTRIEPFDPLKAAAYYTAKYAAKQLGGLHFGGTLAGIDLDRERDKPERRTGVVVAPSANVPSHFFRMTLSRRHR